MQQPQEEDVGVIAAVRSPVGTTATPKGYNNDTNNNSEKKGKKQRKFFLFIVMTVLCLTLASFTTSSKALKSYKPYYDDLVTFATTTTAAVAASSSLSSTATAPAPAANDVPKDGDEEEETKKNVGKTEDDDDNDDVNEHTYTSSSTTTNATNANKESKQRQEKDDDNSDSFSACLLIMDDNHYLIEWIAYHYTTLPLRRLIVAVDPRSKTSPQPVLDRWNGRINITLWEDHDYNPNYMENLQKEGCRAAHNMRYTTYYREQQQREKQENPNHTNGTSTTLSSIPRSEIIGRHWLSVHRLRQPMFMSECMKQLKRENRSWTLLIDTDEYLTVNNKVDERMKSDLRTYVPSFSSSASDNDQDNNNTTTTTDDNMGTTKILDRIQDIQRYNVTRNMSGSKWLPRPKMYQSGCYGVPRLSFGVKEDNNNNNETNDTEKISSSETNTDIPPNNRYGKSYFNTSTMATLRFQYSSNKQQTNGKPIVDVSKVEYKHLRSKSVSVHPGLKGYCTKNAKDIMIKDSYFVVHHYAGSYEQWIFRKSDSRISKHTMSYEKYLDKYKDMKYSDSKIPYDTISGWFPKFVKEVGIEDAQKLLKDVGNVYGDHQNVLLPHNYPSNQTLSFEWCYKWHHKTGSFTLPNITKESEYLDDEVYFAAQEKQSSLLGKK